MKLEQHILNMKVEAQLNHPFYKEVDDYRNEIKLGTMRKAAEKYDEPFEPESWTSDELADHAMMENYDQSVYITGMRDKLRELEQLVKWQAELIEKMKQEKQDYLTRGSH